MGPLRTRRSRRACFLGRSVVVVFWISVRHLAEQSLTVFSQTGWGSVGQRTLWSSELAHWLSDWAQSGN